MKTSVTITLLSNTLLFGCGGAATTPNTPNERADYTELVEQFDGKMSNYASTIESSISTETRLNQVTFSGYTRLTEVTLDAGTLGTSLTAEVSLEITLSESRNAVTGQISNFHFQNGDRLQGTLTISNGQTDTTGDPGVDYALNARISGDLTTSDNEMLAAQGGLNGDFLGTSLEAIRGNSLIEFRRSASRFSTTGIFIADR